MSKTERRKLKFESSGKLVRFKVGDKEKSKADKAEIRRVFHCYSGG